MSAPALAVEEQLELGRADVPAGVTRRWWVREMGFTTRSVVYAPATPPHYFCSCKGRPDQAGEIDLADCRHIAAVKAQVAAAA